MTNEILKGLENALLEWNGDLKTTTDLEQAVEAWRLARSKAPLEISNVSSDEVDHALEIALAERDYPSNPKNAARAGYLACAKMNGWKVRPAPPLFIEPLNTPAPEPIEDPVVVPRGLLGAAASCINRGRSSEQVLKEIRRYTTGDQSRTAQPHTPAYGIVDPDYARIFSQARCIAWAQGWTVCMNGSFTRDLDLLLIPWDEKASHDVEHIVAQIADAAGLRDLKNASTRAHGRMSWTLVMPGFTDPRFVDVSAVISSKAVSAVRTLEHLKYTWEGGEQWKPPIGQPPSYITRTRIGHDVLPPQLLVMPGKKSEYPRVERMLRTLLAKSWGGPMMYWDDGEMQYGVFPTIDFLRDHPMTIEEKMRIHGLKALQESGPLKVQVEIEGPTAIHNMPCAVYHEEHAVLDGNTGVFRPSWKAHEEGWRLVKAVTKFQKWLLRFFPLSEV